ncbi:hypothetical protein BW897_30530 [Bacillus cereus]|uniref:Crystaline entomocidal protoxin n=1 Tax=Bacillus cereus TaxID=1396 RepID=A0A1S9TAP6_BACCE|nr:insecticidal delta-endotoxin Cry8Ea1 family protein [Bacillus cereus]OOR07096.1 hypothetical protein BW897_30530 [Bacillus cereus]
MNQNYNNNNYEIMNHDGGCYQPRYPLANAPGSEIQQMNYKDWMDMCKIEGSGELFADSNALRTGIVAGLAITSYILSLAFPVASAVTGIISVLLPILWPEDAGTPGTVQAQFTWEQLMGAVEELIDEKISALVRDNAIRELQKLQTIIRDYQQAICNLKTDPTNEAYKADVRREFNDAEDQAKFAIIDLKASGYEILLLASYAQAANLHLLLLRDVVQYGESWGFSPAEVEQYYSNTSTSGNPGMLQLLAIYTDHCVNWYNTALQQQYKTGDWNEFNDFRRDMTIMVLDIVALWPTYNPRYYPLPTKSQLTRTINTSLLKDSTSSAYIQNVENNVVARPSLFTWVRQVDFFIKYSSVNPPALFGLKHYYQHTLSDNLYETGINGGLGNKTESLKVPPPQAKDEVWAITLSHFGYYYLGDIYFHLTQSADQCINIYHPDSGTARLTKSGLPCRPKNANPCDPCDSTNPCINEITNLTDPCDDKSLYSHRFSYFGAKLIKANEEGPYYSYGWTHVSADVNNLIDPEKITQIPAVKGHYLEGSASTVIKGPGSTGGDLVSLSGNSTLDIRMESQQKKAYQLRIRYACQQWASMAVIRFFTDENYSGAFQDFSFNDSYNFPQTYSGGELTYNSFGYVTIPTLLDPDVFAYKNNWEISLRAWSNKTPIIIDKLEFIPIEGSVEEYEANQALEKAWKAVNALFTNDAKNALQLGVTDYDVDQAANKVDCMSDAVFPKEKMILLDQVKFAKRLSQKQNLLNDGDFESPDWSGENGWKTSSTVYVAADNPIFKGRYLNMPGATSSPFTSNVYPAYAYQKVDESKLKPYTRYLVRGFVGSSNELELFVTRYGKEVHNKMNIPLNPMNTWNQPARVQNSCGTRQVSGYTASSDPCQANAYTTTATAGMMMPPNQGLCEVKQNFVFHIDVGEVDQRANLGIGVWFNISSPEGMAQLDNLEVIEANPLTGEALARVKKREQKWKRELEQKCAQTEKFVTTANKAVNDLFTDARQDRLKATTTMQNIVNAEEKVKAIPYVYDSHFEDVPGMNFDIFTQLQSQVMNAFGLYGDRNVIQNGDFSSGLVTWHATDGANVQERDGRSHVLVLSNWIANVSQDVCVQPERGYVFRVIARKEGTGKGYVTISDCTEENTETVTFTANEDVTTPRPPMRPRRSVTPPICDMPRYAESFGTVPDDTEMMNMPQASYGTESCSCGCGNTIHNQSENYQTNPYQSTPSLSSMNGSSSDYITKTIEIFPEINRVRIEIGETQGTFLVESIELISMEE